MERGFAQVTVAEIAHEAGIAVKTVYVSAGDRLDILRETVRRAAAHSGAQETVGGYGAPRTPSPPSPCSPTARRRKHSGAKAPLSLFLCPPRDRLTPQRPRCSHDRDDVATKMLFKELSTG
ncbi:TetR family transcriptional regulator [Streptomyces scopuliridis]|uniref:TetR family transcriptional regulator n=1 Tax=Streptomyces scopuliridis TaxID=452529 RepID=UPI0035D7EC41